MLVFSDMSFGCVEKPPCQFREAEFLLLLLHVYAGSGIAMGSQRFDASGPHGVHVARVSLPARTLFETGPGYRYSITTLQVM